jgi:hypothetical protein
MICLETVYAHLEVETIIWKRLERFFDLVEQRQVGQNDHVRIRPLENIPDMFQEMAGDKGLTPGEEEYPAPQIVRLVDDPLTFLLGKLFLCLRRRAEHTVVALHVTGIRDVDPAFFQVVERQYL